MWALSRSHNLQPLRPASARVESRRVSGQWVPSPRWVRLGRSAETCRRSQTLSPRGGCPPARRAGQPNSRPPAAVGPQAPAAARPSGLAGTARTRPGPTCPGLAREEARAPRGSPALSPHLAQGPDRTHRESRELLRGRRWEQPRKQRQPAELGQQHGAGGARGNTEQRREPGGGATRGPHPTTPGGRTRPAALPARSAPPRPSRLAGCCQVVTAERPGAASLRPPPSLPAPPEPHLPRPPPRPLGSDACLGPRAAPGVGLLERRLHGGRQALL